MENKDKLIFRQSYIKDLLKGCQLCVKLGLDGAKQREVDCIINGTKEHKKIEIQLKKGVIPKNVEFVIKPEDIFTLESEKYVELHLFDNVYLKAEMDYFNIDGKTGILKDWKFVTSEFAINKYNYEWIQPVVYQYLILKTNPELEQTTFQYVMPEYQKYIDVPDRPKEEIFDIVEHNIIPKIKNFIRNYKEDNIFPNYSNCKNCLVNCSCPEIQLPKLKKEVSILTKKFPEITNENANKFYTFIEQGRALLDNLENELKEKMIIEDVKPFAITENCEICLKKQNGKKNLIVKQPELMEYLINSDIDPDLLVKYLRITPANFEKLVKDSGLQVNLQDYIKTGNEFYKFDKRKKFMEVL